MIAFSRQANEELLKGALTQYGLYLAEMMENFSVSRWKIKFKITDDYIQESDSPKVMLRKITSNQLALIRHMKKLVSSSTFWNQTKEFLLYNVFSTKVLPALLKAGGMGFAIAVAHPIFDDRYYSYNPEAQAQSDMKKLILGNDKTNIMYKKYNKAYNDQLLLKKKKNPNFHWDSPEERAFNVLKNDPDYKADIEPMIKQRSKDLIVHGIVTPLIILGGIATAGWLVGNVVHDYQIDKYNQRIKDKQKNLENKRLMKEIKDKGITTEKDIDLNYVIGHKIIIERDLSILQDFLTNPLKHKAAMGSKEKGVLSTLF